MQEAAAGCAKAAAGCTKAADAGFTKIAAAVHSLLLLYNCCAIIPEILRFADYISAARFVCVICIGLTDLRIVWIYYVT